MKYRYLVGVGVNGVNNKNPGEKYLDFFCEYTDELIKQATMEQIINYSWSNEMGKKPDNPAMHELNGIRRIAVGRKLAHGLLVCLFNSNHPWTREEMNMHVKYTPLEKLKDAKVNI